MDSIDTSSIEKFLAAALPNKNRFFVTLTWAQSLDGRIAAKPGTRTRLSGAYTKKMTHYLRMHHDAILIGIDTVNADDPRLNCRYSVGVSTPRPVILDPQFSWDIISREWAVLKASQTGATLAPYVFVNQTASINKENAAALEKYGGKIIKVHSTRDWPEVYAALEQLGISSLMVEGGAKVISSCLRSGDVSAIVITVAPVFLGREGVDAAPDAPAELSNVRWWSNPDVPESVCAGVKY